jgi:uncharacterized protein YgiM (DUF1202 family)
MCRPGNVQGQYYEYQVKTDSLMNQGSFYSEVVHITKTMSYIASLTETAKRSTYYIQDNATLTYENKDASPILQ